MILIDIKELQYICTKAVTGLIKECRKLFIWKLERSSVGLDGMWKSCLKQNEGEISHSPETRKVGITVVKWSIERMKEQ